jgi:hypothetical protein
MPRLSQTPRTGPRFIYIHRDGCGNPAFSVDWVENTSDEEMVRGIGFNLFEELTDEVVQHRVPIRCGSCGAPMMKYGEPLRRANLVKVN